MWRSVLLLFGLCGVLAGCSWSSSDTASNAQTKLSPVITRHSLGGIELGQSQAAVERLTGSGHKPPGQAANHVLSYAVPGGRLVVAYGRLFTSDPQDTVQLASTDSRWFRTSGGVGVGSSLAEVDALGAMNCAPTDNRHAQCQTLAYGPGLEFDLTDGHVVRVALVRRSN
jgi:hypothetical protein